jgi:hypothetical protein
MIILSIPAIRQRKPFLFCLVVLFLVVPGWADDAPLRGLAGPPFTDPSQIQEMPEEWKKQPVQHDPSVGDVDIAITLDQNMRGNMTSKFLSMRAPVVFPQGCWPASLLISPVFAAHPVQQTGCPVCNSIP